MDGRREMRDWGGPRVDIAIEGREVDGGEGEERATFREVDLRRRGSSSLFG